jgi:peptidoglycan/LPS O-acetylase OafA/YrhL
MLGVPVALMAMKYGGNGLSVEWSQSLFWWSLPLSLLMLPTPTTGPDGVLYPFNPVLWTIFFEIVVNLLYALLARHLRDNSRLVALVIVSAAALVTYGLGVERPDGGPTWGTFAGGLSRMMFSFFCGVLICRFRRPVTIHSSLVVVSLLASLLVLFGIPHSNVMALGTILFVFPVLVLMGASVEPERGLARIFRLLGASSYAVYALHKPLYQILLGFLMVASPVKPQSLAPGIGIGYLLLVFAGCVLIDRFYDVPVRRLLGTWQRRPTASSTAG